MTDLTVLKAALVALDNTPHGELCNSIGYDLQCNCWKADAEIPALRSLITRMEAASSESLQTNSLSHPDDKDVVSITPAMQPTPRGEVLDHEAERILVHAYCKDQFDNQEDNIGCNRESMQVAWKALKAHLTAAKPNGE